MKKFVFSFAGISVISVLALSAQTNTAASGSLTPPADTAPVPSTSTISNPTAPVVTPSPSPAPVVTAPAPSAPVVTQVPAPTAPPVQITPRPAPPAKVVVMAPTPPKSHAHRPYHLTPVSWIVATRNRLHDDDRYVTIIGHVTRRIGDDEYWFTDGTGSVRLDSENFDLPIGRKIVIGGRIDQAWLGIGHLEVDVVRWRYDR